MDTNERSAFVIEPTGYPRSFKILGVDLTCLASHKNTGAYEVLLLDGAEGSGPPPHHHDWEESLYVTRGEITFRIGKTVDQLQEVVARAGTFLHLPANTVHAFTYGKGGGQILDIGSKYALEPLSEQMDAEISHTAPDFKRLKAISASYGSMVLI